MKKREGFKGQRSIVLPDTITGKLRKNPLTRLLYVTDIGYYPKAKFHFRKRPHGVDQHILIYCVDGEGEVEGVIKGGWREGGGQNCLPPPEKTTIKRPSLIRVKIWLRRSYTNFSLLWHTLSPENKVFGPILLPLSEFLFYLI